MVKDFCAQKLYILKIPYNGPGPFFIKKKKKNPIDGETWKFIFIHMKALNQATRKKY